MVFISWPVFNTFYMFNSLVTKYVLLNQYSYLLLQFMDLNLCSYHLFESMNVKPLEPLLKLLRYLHILNIVHLYKVKIKSLIKSTVSVYSLNIEFLK